MVHQFRLAAHHHALGFGALPAFAGAITDQFPLKLGEVAQDRQHQSAAWSMMDWSSGGFSGFQQLFDHRFQISHWQPMPLGRCKFNSSNSATHRFPFEVGELGKLVCPDS